MMIAFLAHWPRKFFALLLAVFIWFVVSNSITTTKTFHNIPVRIVNLPEGKIIDGMQVNGLLHKRVALSLTGIESILNDLSPKDLEVLIDARDTPEQWMALITKKNLVCLNQSIDLSKTVQRMTPVELILKKTPRVTERIPVSITPPTGKAPNGYQFLDVFPSQLYVTVTGPEEMIRRLKMKGAPLTFNLSELSRTDLDTLGSKKGGNVLSFFVPQIWKKIALPQLSEIPFELDDPQAATLRIDFLRQDLIPIEASIPITVFFPPKHSALLNPETTSLAVNDLILKKNGIKTISLPLCASGVDRLFLNTVKDYLQIVVIAAPKAEQKTLSWSAQFFFPRELENTYVSTLLAQGREEGHSETPLPVYEQYLRTRFRQYMARFRLYTPKNEKLSLSIELREDKIVAELKQ